MNFSFLKNHDIFLSINIFALNYLVIVFVK